jgi:hypothetical protein
MESAVRLRVTGCKPALLGGRSRQCVLSVSLLARLLSSNLGKENACTPHTLLSISENPQPCEKLPEQSFVILLVFYWFRHEQEIKIVESLSLLAYTIMDYIFGK